MVVVLPVLDAAVAAVVVAVAFVADEHWVEDGLEILAEDNHLKEVHFGYKTAGVFSVVVVAFCCFCTLLFLWKSRWVALLIL